jgi:Eph receptor B1
MKSRGLLGVVLTTGLVAFVLADQKVLLDTTKESMLDWTRYPFGPDAPTPGWVEESFTKFEKNINWRSYVVCDVTYAKNNVNNWLWTPFITRNGANRISIEIKFSLRNCDLFPGMVLQCKETFSLLYYEFDAATREPPPWEPESYKLIDQIAADMGRFTDPTEVIINTETRSIDVTKKGVYFAFRDQGACLSLLAVKVYYLTCPEKTVGFAHYPETPTGPEVTSILKIGGKCVENAEVINEPYNLCQGDGTWNFHSGQCACMAGYEADSTSQSCTSCPLGRFKHSSGDGPCLICPPHSQALYSGSVECTCNEGYYRAPGDARTAACTRPPSAPRNLTYRWLDQTTLLLSWDPPSDEGGRSDTQYRVECPLCSAAVVMTPKSPSSQASVTINNLQPGATYKIRVLAVNGISGLSVANDNYAEISAFSNGGGRGAVVMDLRVVEVKETQARLMWRPPRDQLDVDAYEVRYFIRGGSRNSSQVLITKKETATVSGLRDQTSYGFEVRAQTASQGWGDFGPAVYVTTGEGRIFSNHDSMLNLDDPVFVGEGEEDSDQVRVAVGVIVAVIIIVSIVGVLVFFIKRNSTWSKQKQQMTDKDCDSLDYRGLDSHFNTGLDSLPIVQTHHGGLGAHPIYNPFSSHKTYVDPHTYEDPNLAVRQFAKEIDARFITIEAIIGGGEFGDVCRGRLSIPDRNDMLVAIKTLKPGSTDKARADFLTEASIMGQFEHPNVIFLQGVVTKSNPIMIITEFMENGSLDTFLRANDGKFQVNIWKKILFKIEIFNFVFT